MASMGDYESLKKLCKMISEELSPSGMVSLRYLIEDTQNYRISHNEFSESIQLLFENDRKTKQDVDDTELEEGEIREDHVLAIRAKVDENSKEVHIHDHGNLKIVADAGTRVIRADDENPKIILEGKKRSMLHSEPVERTTPNKTRTSKRLQRVTPSYKLITEEEQCPVKYKVLNNECLLKKFKFDDPSEYKTVTAYEAAMERCEDGMYEADMLMEALKSAVEKAEKVVRGEMRVEDLGVKFYRCIKEQFGGDMYEAVRQDHKKGLPVILPGLKQKLNRLTIAREKQKSGWKKVIEKNTAKQRDSTSQGHKKKRKGKQQR